MDLSLILVIATGSTSLIVAILSHLRTSNCCKGFCRCETRTPRQSMLQTPRQSIVPQTPRQSIVPQNKPSVTDPLIP